jgi:hypothetical protein
MAEVEGLSEIFGAILQDALDRGFELPLRVVTLGINGSVLAVEYQEGSGGLECRTLCQHFNDGGIKLPVNIYLSDAGNAATLIKLESEKSKPVWVQ